VKYHVQSFCAGALVMLGAVLVLRSQHGTPEHGGARADLPAVAGDSESFPRSAILSFALIDEELPEGYQPVTATNVLGDLGLTTNPDLIGRKGDLAAIGEWGGSWGFCAVYGATNEARLLLHGVYFRLDDYVAGFAEFQREKQRHVACFKKPAERGAWLLMVAKDPEGTYTEDERGQVMAGVAHYQQRLGLDMLFNDLDSTNGP
jgi:hypothetical protein